RYDFVLSSSSLQYARDWRATLRGLARATGGHLFITSLPTVGHVPSFVFVQRPHRFGYETEYLGWCLNRGELIEAAGACGLTLLREFVIGHQPLIHGAPEQTQYYGFLFQPAPAVTGI